MSRRMPRRAIVAASAFAMVATLAGCATGGSASSPIRVGWSGEFPPLDPAASDSVGSFALLGQLYPSLLVAEAEQPEPVPEIAESAEWTDDGVYTVVLKPGLEFANGDKLTASDVKFSVERQLALQPEDGAWRGFVGVESVEIVDPMTVEFHTDAPLDTGLPFVLAGPAGLVLDEETFFADELTNDDDILDAQPFAGPYTLDAIRGDVLVLAPHLGFAGAPLAASSLEVRSGTDSELARALGEGTSDVLVGGLGAENVQSLVDDEAIDMARAVSGRLGLLAFDFAHMPFGSRAETPDAAKAAAVRGAIADVVDREALIAEVGARRLEPSYGYVADGIPGGADVIADRQGDGEGGPDVERAAAALAASAIPTPVELSIHVVPGGAGELGAAQAAALADQLDDSGLFDVSVVETDAEGLGSALVAGDVQAVFTSVLPATSDPRGYLDPFRSGGLLAPGYADADVDSLLDRSTTEADPGARAATLLEAQNAIAAQLPAIPITQGVRVVFARGAISGFGLDDALPLDLSRLRR